MLIRRTTEATRALRAGFTLMELLVVVAILVVLAGVATPMYLSYLEQSKVKIARADVKKFAGLLNAFRVAHQDNPEFAATGGFPPPESGFAALVQQGDLKQEPIDPWNRPYTWTLQQLPSGLLDPVVMSAGPNGIAGDADDIVSN